MKNSFSFLSMVFAMTFLSSCVLEQDIHFKEDFSGEYHMRLDMSSFMAMAGDSAESADTQISTEDFKEMEDKISAIPGISNLKTSAEEGVYDLSYNFADLNSVTLAGDKSGEETGGFLNFTKKGKKLIINMKPPKKGEEEISAEEMESMKDMFTFRYNIKFDKTVSKIKSKFATLNKETNTVVFEFGMAEYFNPKTAWKTEISFK